MNWRVLLSSSEPETPLIFRIADLRPVKSALPQLPNFKEVKAAVRPSAVRNH